MTAEKRQLIGLDDIVGFEFECLKCHTKITIPIADAAKTSPSKCPHCPDEWLVGSASDKTMIHAQTFTAIGTLKEAMRQVLENTGRIGCAFRIELKAAEDE